jgi:hypothetical protein
VIDNFRSDLIEIFIKIERSRIFGRIFCRGNIHDELYQNVTAVLLISLLELPSDESILHLLLFRSETLRNGRTDLN